MRRGLMVLLLTVLLAACRSAAAPSPPEATPSPSATLPPAATATPEAKPLPSETVPAATEGPTVEVVMYLNSSAFAEGERIPEKYTCEGEDISPPLEWGGVPEGTRSFVLIADDPDAPGGTWVHWVLYDLPGDTRSLPEGNPASLGVTGNTDFRRTAYGGPCPPPGKAHRYFFTLYAVDLPSLGLPAGAGRSAVEGAMEGHILAQTQWMGTYGR